MKKTILLMSMLVILAQTSCSSKGDTETEKKIAGTWTTKYHEPVDEDIQMVGFEEIRYDLDSHALTSNISAEYYYDEEVLLGTIAIAAEGTWKATKEELIETYDTDNIIIDFSSDFLENSEYSESEIKSEIINEIKGEQISKITSISKNEIRIIDPDGEPLTYKKL